MSSFTIKSLATCLVVCVTAIAHAKNAPKPSSEACPSTHKHYRASVRHIEGGGIGYDQGYTTLEGFFAPDPQQLRLMPFLDVRGHVFNNGKMAANAGIGFRGIFGCRTYGLNSYYDYRNTKKIHYNQVGVGLETLGKRWDFRINGYLPVGKKMTSPYDTKFDKFSGHYLLLSQKRQFAMKGSDAELGFHFGKSRLFDFYAAAGPYYYIGEIGSNTWGGKGRLAGKFKEYITLEVSDSYDNMFRNNFQCQLTFTFPFGGKSRPKAKNGCHSCHSADTIVSRMVQPVGREEIVVVGKKKKSTTATNPATGEPLYFVFVDNTSHSSGTYESPYPTLVLAQTNSRPGDILYVFPGDGTTTGMDAGITLQQNQRFWGSGINHSLQTSQGTITIPAHSSSTPQMTNTAGDGITLAAVNEVSGFTLQSVVGNGIVGSNAESILISSCTIDLSQADHIHLDYSAASGVLTLNNLILTNAALNPLFITSIASSTTCTISNCTIQDNAVGIDALFTGSAAFNLINNTIERNGASVNIQFGGTSTLLVSGNNFNHSTSINLAPLFITASASPLSATIENNIISDNLCGAIHFILNNTVSAPLTIKGNTIAGNDTGSIGPLGSAVFIDPSGTTSGNCNLVLADNTFSGNTAASLLCFNGEFNTFQVTATSNTLTGNGGGGCVFANPCSSFTLNATNNTITGGGDHGITTTDGTTMTTASMTLSNNQITGNTNLSNGILLSHTGTQLNFVATNNTISDNTSSGIIMFSSGGIENVALTIENNTISNNQNLGSNAAGGIDIEPFTNLSGTFTNNTLSNNVSSGVFIGSAEASPSVCLTMTGNNSSTAYVFSNGSGVFNLAPCDVETVNTGTFTLIGTITPVLSCPGGVPCPP